MSLARIAVLALIQGMAELLPISSSAHVIAAERLMGLDPSSPRMTFLLVMLHTGTTVAVIVYFWRRWSARAAEASPRQRKALAGALLAATAATGVVGLLLKHVIETVYLKGTGARDIEAIFSNLPLMAASLAAAGALIIWAGLRGEGGRSADLGLRQSVSIGLVQGLCLPFRGFSRSGATISSGMLLGVPRALSEDFSFALSVLLTPPVIAREAWRLSRVSGVSAAWESGAFKPGLLGMFLSFLAGLAALRWLSNWLESGRWRYFGYYCLLASAGVLALSAFLRRPV
ncbi:MAG: undecaprenyl-diphosphate phosphatase [Elusimicrobia bacterium]|nr:undecaprenyl-diphosphate phosphatase [Elusimicrobiota bacterium]MDE2425583.1 undecaprenyl-diphosphate phosphatase [Elusimicrobiota bacterium]